MCGGLSSFICSFLEYKLAPPIFPLSVATLLQPLFRLLCCHSWCTFPIFCFISPLEAAPCDSSHHLWCCCNCLSSISSLLFSYLRCLEHVTMAIVSVAPDMNICTTACFCKFADFIIFCFYMNRNSFTRMRVFLPVLLPRLPV